MSEEDIKEVDTIITENEKLKQLLDSAIKIYDFLEYLRDLLIHNQITLKPRGLKFTEEQHVYLEFHTIEEKLREFEEKLKKDFPEYYQKLAKEIKRKQEEKAQEKINESPMPKEMQDILRERK